MILKSNRLLPLFVLCVFSAALFVYSADSVDRKTCEATTVDVPVLQVGDTWSYKQDLWYNSSSANVHLIEEFTFTVNSIEEFNYRGNTYWGYNLTIAGSILGGDGRYDSYDIDVTGGTISGYKFLKMSDLGFTIDKWYRYATIEVDIGLVTVDGEIWLDYALIPDPAVEEMDFKVTANEIFYANTSMRAVGYFKYDVDLVGSDTSPFDDTSDVKQKYTCYPIVSIYGYDCHYVHGEFIGTVGGTKQWYNSTVKQNVREDWYDMPYVGSGGDTVDYVRILTSYTHAAPPATTITENIEPEIVKAGKLVNITGTVIPAPPAGTTIIAKIPEYGYEWTNVTDAQGNYFIQFTAPFEWDTTPTSYDMGSFGIVVAIEGSETTTYTVATLTIISPYESMVIQLEPGWNFISLPLHPIDEKLTAILEPIDGRYDIVQWFDASEQKWKIYEVTKPQYLNTLKCLNVSMGFWINISVTTQVQLGLTGLPVEQPVSIQLYKGWNMVGYPGQECDVATATQSINQFEPVVYGFDATAPYNLRMYLDTDILKPGSGYWLYVNGNCVWQLP